MFGLNRKRKTEDELLNALEVSKLLNCSPSWVYSAADTGLIPCVKFSPLNRKGKKKERNLIRFKKGDIWRVIDEHYSA